MHLRVAGAAAALVLTVGLFPATAGAQPTSECVATDGGYRCTYGPVLVAPGGMEITNDLMAAPPEAGYITSARATIVDNEGIEIDPHMVHLHHALWVNPAKDDLTCDSFAGYPGYDRFFATGKERTPMVLPDGYGYYWNPGTAFGPRWAIVAHIDGMHHLHEVMEVTIVLDVGFAPGSENLTDIVPVWLDVKNCSTNPVFDVPRSPDGPFKKKWSYKMPQSGHFIAMAGHLHDGGIKLRLRNVAADKQVFTSRARYEDDSDPSFLTSMTSRNFALPGKPVTQGDKLKLVAVYRTNHRTSGCGGCAWDDVMGIMLGAFVPSASAPPPYRAQ